MRRTLFGFVVLAVFFLMGCQASRFYVPQSENEALDALDKAADDRFAAVDRISWADAAIRSNYLQKRDLAEAYYQRGIARDDLGQFEYVIEDMDQVIRLSPNDGDAYGARGTALHALGYYDDAIDDYRQAYRITRNQAYLKYERMAADDRRQGRAPPGGRTDPPRGQPVPPQSQQYVMYFEGFYAERIQRDSLVHPSNEMFFHIDAAQLGDNRALVRMPRNRTAYTNIKKGTRRSDRTKIWTGQGKKGFRIVVDAQEYDKNGKPDSLGAATAVNVDVPNLLARGFTKKYGFNYHVHVPVSQNGARYHFFFSFAKR